MAKLYLIVFVAFTIISVIAYLVIRDGLICGGLFPAWLIAWGVFTNQLTKDYKSIKNPRVGRYMYDEYRYGRYSDEDYKDFPY